MKISKKKLEYEMAKNFYTIDALSKKSGVSKITISRIRSGKIKNPQSCTLGKLATALGVDVTEIIEEE